MSKKISGCILLLVLYFFAITGCSSERKPLASESDTPVQGTIHISADESFRPVIDAQVQVYESNFPGTHIIVHYMPEADCLKEIWKDSIRMIITTKQLTTGERDFISDSLRKATRQVAVAMDAIAVIVNPSSSDTVFTMQDIKDILTGKRENLTPVFDGVKATSTVRFIVDSILRGDSLTKKAMAARTSDSVINYVAATPGAIGFIGVSWIGNKDDSSQLSFLQKVKIAYVESIYSPGKYFLPVQQNIYALRYPMVRDLVYLLKENHRGLGTGFANFMNEEIGQLIFKRAYLVPLLRDFTMREIQY